MAVPSGTKQRYKEDRLLVLAVGDKKFASRNQGGCFCAACAASYEYANNSAMNHITLPPICHLTTLSRQPRDNIMARFRPPSTRPTLPNMNISNGSGSAGIIVDAELSAASPHSNDVSRSNSARASFPPCSLRKVPSFCIGNFHLHHLHVPFHQF